MIYMKKFIFSLSAAIMLTVCPLLARAQNNVDTKIAVNSSTDDKTFVVIISNENYKHEESVPFAKNDGEVFKVYCQKTLGIPEDHIRFAPMHRVRRGLCLCCGFLRGRR